MDTDIAINVDHEVDATNHKFAKLMIGTAAAFIATHAVTAAYDAVVKHRRNKTTETK